MDLAELRTSALGAVKDAADARALEEIRVHYLGRKGEVTAVLRSLGDLPLEERRRIGPEAQKLRADVERAIEERLTEVGRQATGDRRQGVDLTAPAARPARGHLHPLTLVDRDIRRIFSSLNFSIVEGPEVETDHYNFDALNLPPDHPAREMWDTFWVKRGTKRSDQKGADDPLLLRTHTSPVQVRYMESHEPPLQIIVPGRAFRYEAVDMKHDIQFINVEGLMVGKNITLRNFKFVIEAFFTKFFTEKIEFRYRPSYFPFVEPGLEMDIKFRGKWMEVMGAGMVHPRVFEYAHYNPRDWRGFAFGMGMERLAMIKYNIPDIRLFWSGDLRFIHQF